MRRLLLTVAICFVGIPSWGAYSYYRVFDFDHTKTPSTQTNFPVLISTTNISLSTVSANGGHVLNSSGFDIVFSTKDTACSFLLNWDTETYNATTGKMNIWVNVPSLSSAVDTIVYMCYGDSSKTTYQGVSTNTWDSNYLAVYHLPDGTTLSALDSTSNHYNLTNNGSWGAATGQVDGGTAKANGTTQYLGNSSIVSPNSITISYWQKYLTADVGNNVSPHAFEWGGLGGSTASPRLLNHAPFSDSNIYWDYADATNNQGRVFASYAAYLDAWTYVTVVYNNSNGLHAIYLNGSSVVSNTFSSTNPNFTGIDINDSDTSFGRENDIRQLDEFRISNSGRSADWITTEYNNQNSPNTFFTMGSEIGTAAGNATGNPDGFEVQGGQISILGGQVVIQ